MAGVVSAIAVVTIVAGALPAMASVTTTAPTEPTSTVVADTSADNFNPSLVVDQAGGRHLLYDVFVSASFDYSAIYAYCPPTANCADPALWTRVTVATAIDYWAPSQLLVTSDGKPRILMGSPYFYASCDSTCSSIANWSFTDLSSKFVADSLGNPQGSTSFALDRQGRPRFVFSLDRMDGSGDDGLVYASCDTFCTSVANWNVTVIRRTTEINYYHQPALVFDSLGRPRVATYFEDRSAADVVEYSAYLECNSACTNAANWSFLRLDASPTSAPGLRLDPAGVAHLITFDQSQLSHYACVSNCAVSTANWVGGPIGLPNGDGDHADLGFTGARPVIVYRLASAVLGMATCVSACNSASSVWQAHVVDSGTSPTYVSAGWRGCDGTWQPWSVGRLPSLTIDRDGRIFVAHVGNQDVADCQNGNLPRERVFVDQLPANGSGGVQKPPADYNGDAKTDFGIYRPSTGAWYVAYTGGGTTSASWGTSGDIPAPGDYNGDAKVDYGIFRPSTGAWYVAYTGGGTTSASWGASGDLPLPLPAAIRMTFFS